MPLTGYYDQRLTAGTGGMGGGTDYSAYQPWQDNGYGNATGSGYNAATQAAVDARPVVQRDTSAGALSFQPQNPNDPYYQRSDIAPFIQATNRDVMGGGKFGVRGWMNEHPVGVMGAFLGAAAGGAALAGGFGGGAGAGSSGLVASTPAASGAAGSAAGGSGLGAFANGGAGGMAGIGGGNAGALAASGAIKGGAGALGGFLGSVAPYASTIGGLLGGAPGGQPQGGYGGQQMPSMPQQQYQQPQMAQRQPTILPGMPQGPAQSYGRKPYQFNGATVWL